MIAQEKMAKNNVCKQIWWFAHKNSDFDGENVDYAYITRVQQSLKQQLSDHGWD